MMMESLAELQHVSKVFETGFVRKRRVFAVDDVSFAIPSEKPVVITLAGESGSGKTTTANLLLGFIKPTSGKVLYDGKDIWHMKEENWMRFRREVQAIFQDPYGSFNPFHKVDRVLNKAVEKFQLASSEGEKQELIARALETVGLSVDRVLGKYPHELSGGERQRIMLARAILLKPKLIIADEPVSMIDVSLRANILNIMLELKKEEKISFVYITHDLSTARYLTDEIIIMYLGSIVEKGLVDKVIVEPLHPYVQLLIDSVPIPNPEMRWKDRIILPKMELTSQAMQVKGCKFYHRCPKRMERCAKEKPNIKDVANDHSVMCHLYD
jgi:peptide/nickel transport system ATP-binding protein